MAFVLSGLFYALVLRLIFQRLEDRPPPDPSALSAVTLTFAQMALQAVAAPPPPESKTVSKPDTADGVFEEPKPERPHHNEMTAEPEPKRVEEVAQVTQEAAAPVSVVETDVLFTWVRAQIEREKYYPVTARRAGHEGRYTLLVKIGADGIVSEASVRSGKGHPLLRRSLEKIMKGLLGRSFGKPLNQAVELPFTFHFNLQ